MRIGNVIRAPGGSKWIVTGIGMVEGQQRIYAVSFDTVGVVSEQSWEDRTETNPCVRCRNTPTARWVEDCEWCSGTGLITTQTMGWKHATVLAPSVRDFILMAVKRMWEL